MTGSVRFDGVGSSVVVATGFGPRIVGLLIAERNLFADLPDDVLEGPGGRPYHLRGGHRLWAAPEIREITYQPDDAPCTLTRIGDGIEISGPPDGAGISKAITITGRDDGWIVDHTLTNHGTLPLHIAPWAIGRFRLGGRVRLPVPTAGAGLHADRSIVLWPNTDPNDDRIRIGRDELVVEAAPGPPTRIGLGGSGSTIVYELEGVRIEKRITVDPDGSYPDLGAAVQVHVDDRSCGLETLGPLAVVRPGGAVAHREEWRVG